VPEEAQAEVVVVGAGLTGLILAGELAARGVDVRVLERRSVGATDEPGPLLEGLHYPYGVARKILGAGRVRDLWRLTIESRRIVSSLGPTTTTGSNRVGERPHEVEALRESAALLQADGFEAEWTGEALRVPGDAAIDPAALVRRLAASLVVCEHTTARRIDDRAPQLRVITDRGDVACEAVALATGASTGELVPFFESIVYPVRRRCALWSARAPGPLRTPRVSADGRRLGWQRPDGRILAVESTPLSDAPEQSWDQMLGFSCDELPCVGPVPGSVRLFVCAGFHGNALGPACARMLAQIITTGRSEYPYRMLDPRRHVI
jgi:glycine/D-amino acid oxidase-like deaminating enzyme